MNSDEQYVKFIEEHYKRLFGVAFRVCKHDPKAAEDIVQEAVIRLRKHVDKEYFSLGYAMTSVHNLCKDHFRKLSRLKEDLAEEMPDGTVPRVEVDYGDTLIDREVYEAVNDLAPPLRNVVFMMFWQNLPPAKIGNLLGISPKQVSRDLYRAKEKLRTALSDRSPKKEGKHRGR